MRYITPLRIGALLMVGLALFYGLTGPNVAMRPVSALFFTGFAVCFLVAELLLRLVSSRRTRTILNGIVGVGMLLAIVSMMVK